MNLIRRTTASLIPQSHYSSQTNLPRSFFDNSDYKYRYFVAQCQSSNLIQTRSSNFSRHIMSKRQADNDHPELIHPSTKRAKEINADTPYAEIKELLESQDTKSKVNSVLHWFRSKDLRILDNRALYAASQLAHTSKVPLICTYINCPAEFEWHGTSPARSDFIFENLALIQKELKELDIPLVFLEAAERDEIVPSIAKFIEDNKITQVFANYEYELRRDIKFFKWANEQDISIEMHHDQTVIEPGTILNEAGKPMKVFTPYHRA